MLAVAVLVPVAYLLGTFPSAAIVARTQGVNIASTGSGNPGASNVARVLGAKWGVLVFVLDGLKGALPAAAGLLLDHRAGAYVLVAAAVLGHMFPVTRQLRGGKGVATMAGAMIVLQPIASAILTVLWLAVRRFTGTASIGSLVLAVATPVVVALLGAPAWEVAAIVALCALVTARHLENIRRLRAGTEL